MIPKDNEQALYEAMKYIFENIYKYDSSVISNETLNRFGSNVISDKILTIYREVLYG